MRIAEIFRSRQGEGFLTGAPSVFVRASGCNLRCWFCDTPYTSWDPEGEDLSREEILRRVDELLTGDEPSQSDTRPIQKNVIRSSAWHTDPSVYSRRSEPTGKFGHDQACRHVVLTGGEPMLFAELVPLTTALRSQGLHITIETAGTLYLPVECDLMSISPKLASSTPSAERDARWHERHEQSRYAPEVIRRLVGEFPYQIKFVIDSLLDCEAAQDWLKQFPEIERARVMLMPQGTDLNTLHGHAEWLQPYCSDHGFQFCPRMHIEWYGCTRGT